MNRYANAALAAGFVALGLGSSASAASLSTGFPDATGQSGMFFDILVGAQNITFTALGVGTQDDSGEDPATGQDIDIPDSMSIWLRSGTWVGNTSDSTGWTPLFDDPNFISNGIGVETFVDLPDTLLSAGGTYALAIFVNDRYGAANGTVSGAIAAQNSDLTMFEGAISNSSYSNPFGGAFLRDPIVVGGTIYYDVAGTGPGAVPLPAGFPLLLAGIAALLPIAARRRRD